MASALKDDQEQIAALARELPRVQPLLEGKTVRRVIYVPGKMLNLVAVEPRAQDDVGISACSVCVMSLHLRRSVG